MAALVAVYPVIFTDSKALVVVMICGGRLVLVVVIGGFCCSR